MPVITVNLLEGRSDDARETLIILLTEAAVAALDVPPASVRVLLNELPPTHWGVGGESKHRTNNRGNAS